MTPRTIAALLSSIAFAMSCSVGAPQNALAELVITAQGEVTGTWVDEQRDVLVFRGIPYAAPPVADLRWQPPQAPAAWEGLREATEFGLPCWQPISPETSIYSRGEIERDEDCLYLNIWTATAASSAEDASGARPVMVWFHGGSHNVGHGHSLIFDGTALARLGVVLVSINYRLGALGFLAHPGLTAESEHSSSGNYGLLDKIAALEWVRDNVGAFGGDPQNVTIFGQSAGSMSVCSLMASPLAAGVFHKAIGQSAGCMRPTATLAGTDTSVGGASGHQRGVAWAETLGVEGEGPDAVAALRERSPEEIVAAGSPAGVLVDGWFLPKQPLEIFEAGEHNQVPALVGSTADEAVALFPQGDDPPLGNLRASLNDQYRGHGDALLSAYADEVGRSTGLAQREIGSDVIFAWGMRTWARLVERSGQDAYLYFMSHQPPVFRLYIPERPVLEVPGGERGYGAYHSGDLAYVFGNVGLVGIHWNERDRTLSDQMSRYWANFARTGNPNGEGLPEWPRYQAASDLALELGAETKPVAGVRKEKLDVLDAIYLARATS